MYVTGSHGAFGLSDFSFLSYGYGFLLKKSERL